MDLPLLVLVDGHSLAFRAYYAFSKNRDGGLMTAAGVPTNICFGFVKALLEVVTQQQPQALAIAFDLGEPTFRHLEDSSYKAGRAETPADFLTDMGNLQRLLQAMNFPTLSVSGYEADDVLGTVAMAGVAAGYRVKILSGDRDLFQLVDDGNGVSVLYAGGSRQAGNSMVEMDEKGVFEKLGVTPDRVVDYKALCGDKSDNIPGVMGIGEKTAVKLLAEYGSLAGIYVAVDAIKGANREKLLAGKEAAERSQFLARIVTDVGMELDWEKMVLNGFDLTAVLPILQELELNSFQRNIIAINERFGATAVENLLDELFADRPPVDLSELSPDKPDRVFDDSEDISFFTAAETTAAKETGNNQSIIQVRTIDTLEKLAALVETLSKLDTPVAWDTETTDLDPLIAEIVGIGCCWGDKEDEVAYIPLHHVAGTQIPFAAVKTQLSPLLENPKYPKILQNAKFDRRVFRRHGISLQGTIGDPMLMSYVLNPDKPHNLTELSQTYLDITAQEYTDLVPKGKTIADISIPAVANYCGMDAYTTRAVYFHLRQALEPHPQLWQLFADIELPLEPILAKMEDTGVTIDVAYLQQLSSRLAIDLAAIETTVYAAAETEFNLASPKQLAAVLFDRLGLDTKGIKKNKTGYSTDVTTLEKLQGKHPVVDSILSYRTLAKLKSTYADALPALISPYDGRVHTDFNQAVTSTGRLSSSNPNLQNIPIRSEFSRQIRRAFIPRLDWLLIAADYSQIELRILAHLSGEPVLIDAYQNDRDIHTITAQLLFEKSEIDSQERRLGKIINFGVIYGMGAAKFARESGFKTTEAKEFIDKFYRQYPAVFNYLETLKKQAISQGYVETICGRRRYFKFETNRLRYLAGTPIEEIDLATLKNIGQFDAASLRQAANAPIQGSCADIVKLATIAVDRLIEPHSANLILQVHDELILEMPSSEWEILKHPLQSAMENAISLRVPLKVELGSGNTWMETK